MRQYIIGIDVGGTKVAGGLVTRAGKLQQHVGGADTCGQRIQEEPRPDPGLIERLMRAAGGKHNVGGIGICAPGPLNPKTGVVLNPPNLFGWRNIHLTQLLEKQFGVPGKTGE